MAVELVNALVATDADRLLQAEAEVRGYCGWHIAPSRSETLTLDGSGSCTLLLPSLHVTSIVSITESGTLLDAADYAWSASGVVERVAPGRAWSALPRSIVIELEHGWSTPPPDVAAIVQQLASRLGHTAGLTSKTVGPFSESYAPDLFAYQRSALARYKLPPRV